MTSINQKFEDAINKKVIFIQGVGLTTEYKYPHSIKEVHQTNDRVDCGFPMEMINSLVSLVEDTDRSTTVSSDQCDWSFKDYCSKRYDSWN